MTAWTISMPAANSSSHPKNNMETTVAATARTIARTPSSSKAMPKARNQPQLLMISAGIRTSKAWISLMALPPLAEGTSANPWRVAVNQGTSLENSRASFILPLDEVKASRAWPGRSRPESLHDEF